MTLEELDPFAEPFDYLLRDEPAAEVGELN